MKNITKLIVVGLLIVSSELAAASQLIELAVAPEAKTSRASDIKNLLTQILVTASPGDTVSIYDAGGGRRVGAVTIPDEVPTDVPANVKMTWIMKLQGSALVGMVHFLNAPPPQGSSGNLMRYLSDLQNRLTDSSSGHAKKKIVYFGNPVVSFPQAYSLIDRYPSDAFLLTPDNPYSTVGRSRALAGMEIHIIHSANWAEFSRNDPTLHHEKLQSFFGKNIAQQGGQLLSFTGNVDQLAKLTTAEFPKMAYGTPQLGQGKLLLYPVLTPQIKRDDEVTQATLWATAIGKNPPPPQRGAAPLDIGITWDKNVDLDIYTKVEDDVELSYKQQSAEKYGARFLKDITTLPDARGFETVTYAKPVPLNHFRVYINHYAGGSASPINIEVRMRVDGKIYFKKYHLNPGHGTLGGGNRDGSPEWLKVNIPEVLGLN
ncbi:MAG: hypothetical protein ACYC2R_08665 [Burkholderiales bacterium]